MMTLTQRDSGCAEYRTVRTYGFGYYEVRMQVARGSGLMSGSFFTYTGTYRRPDHHEIDVEGLGRSCSIQLNHYGRGVGGHERVLSPSELGFDPCDGLHNYGFAWRPDRIDYYIDGRLVHSVTTDIPSQPGQLMTNIWSGMPTVDGWLGHYSPGQFTATYDAVRFAPLSAPRQPVPPPPAPAPTVVPSTPVPPTAAPAVAPTGPLMIRDLQANFFAFGGGHAERREEGGATIYTLTADHVSDPGLGIGTGNAALGGRRHLTFDLRGSVTRHGQYARLVAQVYRDTDSEGVPTVLRDPLTVTDQWVPVTIDLNDQFSQVQKVQLILVTDNGSCRLEFRNMRFE
jgi:hypothetical protein